jgi:hypothetical protein
MTANEYREHLEKIRPTMELHKFMSEVMNYKHDYETVVIGISQIMIKAFSDANKHENGGITGMQASFLGWEMIKYFFNIESGRLLNWRDMLYPQYEEEFSKSIGESTWQYLQSEAQKRLNNKNEHTHPDVIAHWQSIVEGQVPFGFKIKKES